jgi:hypothetical protein
MKRNHGYIVYTITGIVLAAALCFAFYPGEVAPQVATAGNIAGVGMPTARLVEVRTTRIEITLPVIEKTVAPAQIVEPTLEDITTFYFAPPDVPVVEDPPAINLVVPDNVTYHLEPLQEQTARLTLVH